MEENVVIEGLLHKYCRINFCDWKILSLLSLSNITITSQVSLEKNAYMKRLIETRLLTSLVETWKRARIFNKVIVWIIKFQVKKIVQKKC